MRRFAGVIALCLILSTVFSTAHTALAATPTCQLADGIIVQFVTGAQFEAGEVILQPGEVLTAYLYGDGTTPAMKVDITGPNAPGLVNLPYTVNYASIPNGGTWDAESTTPTALSKFTVLYHCGAGSSASSGGITWFAPGDGRVDPLPGNRIAVWCNTTATPPTVVIYGVGNASNGTHGFWLATFNNADLLKAGAAGIVKNAGAGNGTVSLANDGNGNFYAAWTGGIFNAAGHGDFAKSFSCTF